MQQIGLRGQRLGLLRSAKQRVFLLLCVRTLPLALGHCFPPGLVHPTRSSTQQRGPATHSPTHPGIAPSVSACFLVGTAPARTYAVLGFLQFPSADPWLGVRPGAASQQTEALERRGALEPAMFLVQQQQPGTTSFVQQQQQPVVSTQQWVLQQQQQQQGMGASNRVVLMNSGGGGLQYQQQAPAAQQQQHQQQQVRLAAGGDATTNNQQTVVVNVNGTLQRGIVQNGAVYLLPNNGGGGGATVPQVVTSMPQVGATLMANRGQTLTLPGQQQVHYQQQHQQPMMVQQVLANGQLLVSASAAMVANRGVQLQAQPQPQMQARFSPMPAASVGLAPQTLMNQQQPVMLMNPGGATSMATVGRVAPAGNGVAQMQARPQQQMQMPAQQAPVRGPVAAAAVGPSVLQRPAMTPAVANQTAQGFGANCVSANTASLMRRLGAAAAPQAGARTLPAGSQPMTIAAALAALPSNPAAAAAGVAPTSGELPSPVAPPGTPGMPVGAAANNSAAGTIGAVISKLAAPVREGSSTAAGTTVISGPPAAAAGISPLTSQPGTPSRSNSVGQHSSSSSSGSGSAAVEGDEEGKMSVMRMFARTFIETGIGLEQALSMIQASDREMLAAAFAAEAAAAVGAKAGSAAGAAGSGSAAPTANPTAGSRDGLASLGGEQIVMPPSQGRAPEPNGLQGLSNLSVGGGGGGAFDGEPQASTGQDSFSLGSWGFSLFSSVASDMGSTQTGSFGGHGDKVTAGAPASATDVGTASLFANLHV